MVFTIATFVFANMLPGMYGFASPIILMMMTYLSPFRFMNDQR